MEYMQVAEKAAAFIRKNLYSQQTRKLQHSFRNIPSKAPGFLDDYAFLISGLLDMYEFGSSVFWLAWAIELQQIQVNRLFDNCSSINVIELCSYVSRLYIRMSYSLTKREEVTSILREVIPLFSSV